MALTISATDSELPKPLNAVFQQTLLRNAQVRAPYFAGTVSGELTRSRGSNVVMWRRIENLAAATSTLSELTGVASYMQGRDAAALAVTNITATASKYGNFVILNEEVDLFNFPGQFDKIMQVIGINAGQSLNQLQRDIGEDNATLIHVAGAASDGAVASIMTVNAIKLVLNTIDKNSAITFTPMTTGNTSIGTQPILPAYWGLCHPDVAIDIAGLTGFNSVETYAGQVQTVMGEFGTIGVAGQAVRFISSEDAGVDAGAGASGAASASLNGTSDNADLYTTLIYGQDAIASVGLGRQYSDGVFRAGDDLEPVDVIVKAPSATGTSDPFNEISTVAWKAWHTGGILNAAWVRGIRSGATLLTT
jgi:N4-gp56 family major capsid protein